MSTRITAAAAPAALTLSLSAGTITASTVTRTLAGPVVQYGVYGRTSRGRLKVAPGALRFPADLSRVKLTREHDRADSRGYLTAVEETPDGVIRAALRVSDGPTGDEALAEANDKTRDGFSFDVVDAVVDGDTITSALVIAIGQVGIPAYDDMRIDTIAASTTNPEKDDQMTPEQIARLAALRANPTRTAAENEEMATLVALEGNDDDKVAPDQDTPPAPTVQASAVSVVPAGIPSRAPARTQTRRGALDRFVTDITAALSPGGGGAAAITAALSDVTNTQSGATTDTPAWSGELWSGLQYAPEYTPLLNAGPLTNYEGKGWRWVTKPALQDYVGDKAAIPSAPIATEPSTYTAARMAVGHDIDRKFYDFPNEAFLRSYVEAVREDWAVKLDTKVRAWIESNAVNAGANAGSVLKAASRAALAVKRAGLGRASFIMVADADYESLMDITTQGVPAFLDMFAIDPTSFVSSPTLVAGTVVAGVKQAATVRTLPGSPIRVSAQHISNGGIDEGFFGYWAIEEHHTSAIKSVRVGV